MSLTLEIVTPEKRAYHDRVSAVVVPTEMGEVGILESHVPLISVLVPGEIQVEKDGVHEYLAVDKGFVQVLGDKVSVLTEGAIDVQEIDLEAIAEARKRAEEALKAAKENKEIDPAEMEKIEAQCRFAIAQELAKTNRS